MCSVIQDHRLQTDTIICARPRQAAGPRGVVQGPKYLRWCRSRQRDRFLPPILSLLISENSNQLIRDWGISISSTGGGGLPVVCSSPRCVKMADTTQGPTNGSFCQKKVSCLEQAAAQKCSYLMIPKWISVTNSILPSMNLFHHELFLQTPCLYKLRLCVSRWN